MAIKGLAVTEIVEVISDPNIILNSYVEVIKGMSRLLRIGLIRNACETKLMSMIV
jgi:hypothetical protein